MVENIVPIADLEAERGMVSALGAGKANEFTLPCFETG